MRSICEFLSVCWIGDVERREGLLLEGIRVESLCSKLDGVRFAFFLARTARFSCGEFGFLLG